jgi:SHS2 domain-containing protein
LANPFIEGARWYQMMRYEVLEHTADLMVRAHGRTLKECFENAAFAMMDQIVDASAARPLEQVDIEVEGENHEDLLYNFLSEVLFIFDAQRMVLGKFEVTLLPGRLRCRAWGEPFDRERHEPKQEIKAVTYHELRVDEEAPSITVLFDV